MSCSTEVVVSNPRSVDDHRRPVRVAVDAPDRLIHTGMLSFLAASPRTIVILDALLPTTDVVVVAGYTMDPRQVALLRRKGAESRPAVLVVDALSPDELKQLVGSQVRRILRLSTLTAESLAEAVTDAAGSSGTTVLEHELRDQLKRHQLAGEEASADGLTDREMSVLRLVAEGYDNNEIAQELHFSVRTVKKVLFGFGQRQGLRNRTQMIAHAIRRGFI